MLHKKQTKRFQTIYSFKHDMFNGEEFKRYVQKEQIFPHFQAFFTFSSCRKRESLI